MAGFLKTRQFVTIRTMLGFLLSFALAALPGILFILYFLNLDRRRPEPRGLVVKAVLYGFAAVIPAALIELLLDSFVSPLIPSIPWLKPAIQAFFFVALVEEGLKYFFVRRFIFNRPEFDEVADGIVYSVCVSMGFAMVENLIYGFGEDYSVLIVRAFTAVPLHAAASGIMGYYIGRTKVFGGNYLRRGLLWAIVIHGIYDLFLFVKGPLAFLVLPVVVAGMIALKWLFDNALYLDRYGHGKRKRSLS